MPLPLQDADPLMFSDTPTDAVFEFVAAGRSGARSMRLSRTRG